MWTFDSPPVPFAANLINEAQASEGSRGKTSKSAGHAYIPVVCQCPTPSTGTVRPKVPRYVFVTLPLCGETNLREAFLNCAASYLFVLHYEERVPSGCWYTRRRSTLANCGSDGKDSFHTRIREPSSGARRRSEPGTRTMMLNSLSVFQVNVPLTPV